MLEMLSLKQMAILSLINGSLCALLAHRRRRNAWMGFLVGAFFGLIGIFFFFFCMGKKKVEEQKAPISPFTPLEPLGWHFLDDDRKPIGPMSKERLEEQYSNEVIRPSTLVWHETLKEWTPLDSIIESS